MGLISLMDITTGNTVCCGLLMKYPKGYKESVIDELEKYAEEHGGPLWPLVIDMPCKKTLVLTSRDHFPDSDIRCCENPNHWFVKLEEIENE